LLVLLELWARLVGAARGAAAETYIGRPVRRGVGCEGARPEDGRRLQVAAAVIIFCPACERRVAYLKRPTWCGYCGAVLPEEPIIDPGLPPAKNRPYKLSMNDRRFLKSLKISPQDDTSPDV